MLAEEKIDFLINHIHSNLAILLTIQNKLKTLAIENDSLRHRLENYEDSNKLSMGNLTSMLSQKSSDLTNMKWKLNDGLELKRRVEMDNESMKFELENLRSRYVADMKEK